MAKTHRRYICRECGAVQAQWYGKCPDCGTWDALEEHTTVKGASQDKQRGESHGTVIANVGDVPQAMPITELDDTDYPRLATGIDELDRVLGGPRNDGQQGIVPGSAVLVGGDPGIGKSTLLLQAADQLAGRDVRVLYVTSEESAQQTRLRARRLGTESKNLYVLADTNLARIIEQIRKTQPRVVVIDSVQMIYKGDLDAAPGSVTQLRSCCMELVYMAKSSGIAVVLVGHVTKEGTLAGPRLLEHLVDCVLYFEGDRFQSHRLVRAIKNRFGTTQEVGIFEMTEAGLQQVTDPSGILAAEYTHNHRNPTPGSVICPVLQGTRCLLVEVQALTATGFLGSAKRKTSGIDGNRLAMLIAVLEKRAELRLADQDVFVSVVGGMKIVEPAADAAIALAIAGAHYNRTLEHGTAIIGEVGLGGELRAVQQMELRLREAARLGFTKIIMPPLPGAGVRVPKGCEPIQVSSLSRAIQVLG